MNEEKLYDYSKGLNAPYWIQEIKIVISHYLQNEKIEMKNSEKIIQSHI